MAGVAEGQVCCLRLLIFVVCSASFGSFWYNAFYMLTPSDIKQIRRAGRWNNSDQMTGCYLTSLPFEFMRSSAGFDPDWSGSYFLPRDTVKPPPALLRHIWPDLDTWKEVHDSASLAVEPNKAAGAFLELLSWLREVLLQDAVFLRKHYPQHPVFRDPVFRSREFAAFAAQVEDACRTAEEDSYVATLDRAIPAVAEKLRSLQSQQLATNLAIDRMSYQLTADINKLSTQIRDLSRVSYTVTISPGRSTISQRLEMPKRGRRGAPTRLTTPTRPLVGVATPLPAAHTPVDEQPAVGQASATAADESQIPRFEFPLDVKSVRDLWTVWKDGRAGMPSIESLEADYGSAWRPRHQKSVFCARKGIIEFIARKAREQGGQHDGGVHSLVITRIEELCASWSLDKVRKAIKNGDLDQRWLLGP
jgi:hypothetical protein